LENSAGFQHSRFEISKPRICTGCENLYGYFQPQKNAQNAYKRKIMSEFGRSDWRRFLFGAFLLSVVVGLQGADSRLIITGATVIDGTGAAARSNLTVTVLNERIAQIARDGETGLNTAETVVDARGKFLIPGLWDMHVHWSEKEYLPLFIANGVTGVRIMWGDAMHHGWRKEIEQGTLVGPRLFIGSRIVDGPKPYWPTSIAAGTEAEGRLAVKMAKVAEADFVKVYSLLPREVYFAIADEAKKQALPFEGHVPIAVSAREASAAGQSSVEHLTGVLAACSSREDEIMKSAREALAGMLGTNEPASLFASGRESRSLELETYSETKAAGLFAEFKKNGTWQCPTLTVLHNVRFIDDSELANDSRMKYMPRMFKAVWNPTNDFRFNDRTADDVAIGKKLFQKELEVVGAMKRAGVGILAGTDTQNPYCFPGFSLHDELVWLVRAGLTPLEALQAATVNGARFMNRDKELGTIEKGKLADMVLLDANPLEDIANTKKIWGVVFGGKFYSRAALDEMLRKVEVLASSQKTSIAQALFGAFASGGVEAAIKQYRELREREPNGYDFSEEELNTVGYYLIGMKKYKDAIAVLKLNVEMFPKSANVYDSLGEAYMDDGNNELARENYEKSLKIEPGNTNAVEKLKVLKAR
jgi:imidazolonepropionase-like amidohydrolase